VEELKLILNTHGKCTGIFKVLPVVFDERAMVRHHLIFERSVNVVTGKLEERLLMTGMHMVADITCANCDQLLGWKYVSGNG